eukprot:GFYU01002560.1.p1 GENE.GFYU01002560.1~~GFYU01002560.1.p1  ORF type:complete len:677 (-),score=143.50 GFYU01002560.1:370-2400(-)
MVVNKQRPPRHLTCSVQQPRRPHITWVCTTVVALLLAWSWPASATTNGSDADIFTSQPSTHGRILQSTQLLYKSFPSGVSLPMPQSVAASTSVNVTFAASSDVVAQKRPVKTGELVSDVMELKVTMLSANDPDVKQYISTQYPAHMTVAITSKVVLEAPSKFNIECVVWNGTAGSAGAWDGSLCAKSTLFKDGNVNCECVISEGAVAVWTPKSTKHSSTLPYVGVLDADGGIELGIGLSIALLVWVLISWVRVYRAQSPLVCPSGDPIWALSQSIFEPWAVRYRFNLSNIFALIVVIVEFFQLNSYVFLYEITWADPIGHWPHKVLSKVVLVVEDRLPFEIVLYSALAVAFISMLSITSLMKLAPEMDLTLIRSSTQRTWLRFCHTFTTYFWIFFSNILFMPLVNVFFSVYNCEYTDHTPPLLEATGVHQNAWKTDVECWTNEHVPYLVLGTSGFITFYAYAITGARYLQELDRNYYGLRVFYHERFLIDALQIKVLLVATANFFAQVVWLKLVIIGGCSVLLLWRSFVPSSFGIRLKGGVLCSVSVVALWRRISLLTVFVGCVCSLGEHYADHVKQHIEPFIVLCVAYAWLVFDGLLCTVFTVRVSKKQQAESCIRPARGMPLTLNAIQSPFAVFGACVTYMCCRNRDADVHLELSNIQNQDPVEEKPPNSPIRL